MSGVRPQGQFDQQPLTPGLFCLVSPSCPSPGHGSIYLSSTSPALSLACTDAITPRFTVAASTLIIDTESRRPERLTFSAV
ncbi:unnamed protein product [Pleuronectes platessa]|uniref:Uncharacterized protein n=1 Tax=Pleuronectes platessa TaxID=8262 RepID=A0A9N7YUV3_PLEPL|nr:unnamed protein product [Pleuronectes platessa]